MALVWNLGAAMNVASGVLIAVLGAALLLANPRKDWNRVFAFLAVFWGIQIVSLNTVRLTDSESLARFAGGLGLAFLIPLYFFLASFAGIFPRPRPPFGTSGVAVGLLMVPAGVTLATLFAFPDRLIAEVRTIPGGAFTLVWGPLLPYLVAAPFYAALFHALFVMMRRLDEAASGIERKQITFVLAALTLFVAHNTPLDFIAFGAAAVGLRPVSEAQAREAILFAGIMLAGLVLLGVLATRLVRRARSAATPAEQKEARGVLAALGVAFGTAAVVAAVEAAGGPFIELLGLFRVAAVALIVYAIARYQLFDVDLRVKRVAATSAAAVAGAAVATGVYGALRDLNTSPSLTGLVAAAVAFAAFVPLLSVASRLADRVAPRVSRDGDHVYLRKLEVYRAAVEAGAREGREPALDDAALRDVRTRLGLTDRDHGVVVSLAAARAEPAAAAPDLRPGGVAFGKFVIEKLLAEGGFGRVFVARDRLLGRTVVIKELLAQWRGNPAVVKTFLREAQIAGQLDHVNIVKVHEVEQHGEDYFVIMEHVTGGSLAERLTSGPLTVEEALHVTRGVLAALTAAHARGVVHRDVKPANVLLDAVGNVKLADFGIAQLADDDPERTISGLSTTPRQPGTLQFMSPEQARGAALDARSDVYAVGALLYRMLSGRNLVDVTGLDELAARQAVASAEPPGALAGVPTDVAQALTRALARDPDARFPTAAAFAAALPAPQPTAR